MGWGKRASQQSTCFFASGVQRPCHFSDYAANIISHDFLPQARASRRALVVKAADRIVIGLAADSGAFMLVHCGAKRFCWTAYILWQPHTR